MQPTSISTEPLLDIRHIAKRFGKTHALVDATFSIGRGEVHALIGQNGAGKSTLIKVLTGYFRKGGGEFTFEGKPFQASSPNDAQHLGISTIYQEINLIPLRSVTENICLGRNFRRFGLLDWAAMQEDARRLLARFDIDIDVRRPLGEFNTATQQMVAIARATGFSARLVIMDEPSSSLDEREVEMLHKVIGQLKADGISVIYVSHKLDELYAIGDRITVMRDGRTVRTCPIGEISRMELVSTMIGRDVSKTDGHATAFSRSDSCIGDRVLEARGLAAPRGVRDVDIEVRKGEIVGLTGLLGSGRTETARAIFGVDRLEAGQMQINGRRYRPGSAADGIAAGLGFCSEDRKTEGIVPEMSVAENLTLALLPRISRRGVIDEKREREIVNRYIDALKIKCSDPKQRISELSGGNQQKVLLARWLATGPVLLILDEPTRGIDVGAKAEIQRVIRSLAADGLAVIMISSELEEVTEGADRIVVLRDGRTVAELAGACATEEQVMAAMAHGHEAGEARA
ncbi:sugar ABC transporter ATP-binding protein [Paraburkholderia sp. CNPSo 3272]|uniref:sugar ABC transporter ATP-binding protein n=1 Tax=Paraburkholderia sp. CNPSo 3272 TaxID=2940931 RepID=UPI0020B65B99|nr:sugar ABC transporter ATP-binding protein [Paraburkholderia sp. CNPSo 3272]MCP3722413.1 sugar ABC transporter ATP-binding protein [Paraburkholderia sp. CNPSo 3272]